MNPMLRTLLVIAGFIAAAFLFAWGYPGIPGREHPMLALPYGFMVLCLLADLITTEQGIKRGARESGMAKSRGMRLIMFCISIGATAWGTWFAPGVQPIAVVLCCLGIGLWHLYAARHNTQVAR